MTDLIEFLKTPIGAGLLGILLLAVGCGYFKLTMSERTKGFLKLLGIGCLAFTVLTYMGIPITIENNQPSTTVSDFTVTGSESHSYVTVNQDDKTFVWTTGYDWTGEQIEGATQATFTFSITRGLGIIGLVQTSANVATVPNVVNETTDVSASLISKSGEQYDAIWTRSSGSGIGSITITIAEDADGALVSLNLTLNQAAVRNMDLYDTQVVRLDVAGQPWAIEVLQTSG